MKARIIIFITLFSLAATTSAWAQNASNRHGKESANTSAIDNMDAVFNYVDEMYVDEPDMVNESEAAIKAMLQALDPHSVFIPARDVEKANEILNGKFSGIGIRFNIIRDTIQVQEVINGGPCEKSGIVRGDKIIQIDGKNCTGDSVDDTYVREKLRGEEGSKVSLMVKRIGRATPIKFVITRNDVPLSTVDYCFMVNKNIGYLRLTRFGINSYDEVMQAIAQLHQQGAQSIIFDLRDNGGGYLDVALAITKEFLPSKRLIAYTEGRKSKRKNMISSRDGIFDKGMLVLLVNEGSASASEVMCGALQDWDRAVLIGRRTYGKGLVQRLYTLKDGSQLRLTTARYYTPSGRCIQKAYGDSVSAYYNEINNRYEHGELFNQDSIHQNDTTVYRTSKNRIVYGGGGITPDIFIPMDTTQLSEMFLHVRAKGYIESYALDRANQLRAEWSKRPKEEFIRYYDEINGDSIFKAYLWSKGLKKRPEGDTITMSISSTGDTTHYYPCNDFSCTYIYDVFRATVISNLYGSEAFYETLISYDNCLQAAIRYLQMRRSDADGKSEAELRKIYMGE